MKLGFAAQTFGPAFFQGRRAVVLVLHVVLVVGSRFKPVCFTCPTYLLWRRRVTRRLAPHKVSVLVIPIEECQDFTALSPRDP